MDIKRFLLLLLAAAVVNCFKLELGCARNLGICIFKKDCVYQFPTQKRNSWVLQKLMDTIFGGVNLLNKRKCEAAGGVCKVIGCNVNKIIRRLKCGNHSHCCKENI